MNNTPYPVKKNGVYPVVIDSLAFGGKGVARKDDYVIFVNRAIPGDRINARIIKRKKNYAEAIIDSFIEKSADRLTAPCTYFDFCGGCTWQNLSYENQLKFKTQIVKDALKQLSAINPQVILPILPSANSFSYRNKMEFSFAEKKWLTPRDLKDDSIKKDFALGLHVPGTFDKIIHIENCMLQSENANSILKFVSEFSLKNKLQPYGLRSHEGLMRFLVIRESALTREIMVNIVTAYPDNRLEKLAHELCNAFPFIRGVINNINSKKAQIAVGEKEFVLAGEATIEDEIYPFKFEISANAFFQTNTQQAKELYAKVMEFAEVGADETALDLYCGTGTISLFLAQKCKQVFGFEISADAVQNAQTNAKKYQFENIKFIAGDVIHNMGNLQFKPQLIVTDPPRSGMHQHVVESILNLAPEKIVYVSCNPTTMARDLKILNQKYSVDKVQPVDMFPQTYHIECVTRLTLRE
jgi:23S rRNA (uracil1939-C5)-methyltransferase